MPKATINAQQASKLAEITKHVGPVEIMYDYGSYLVFRHKNIGRALLWTTGKVEAQA